MITETFKATAETEIRDLVGLWAQAVRAMDIDSIVSHYAPDILAFDAIAELQFKGLDSYRRHWEACLAFCPKEGMIFEVHELTIQAGDDLAFATALTRCGGAGEDGEEQTGWMRMTAGYRKRDGRWLIVHEHFSAPFDMQTMKMLDLKP